MLLISRHLVDYNLVPANAVVRVNLAWHEDMESASKAISLVPQRIMVDVPAGRIKPPSNQYNVVQVAELVRAHSNIRYVAVSRVEDPEDVISYVVKLPKHIVVVPKIETIAGCVAWADIIEVLREPRTVMLDHDDLFHDLLDKGKEPGTLYAEYIDHLVDLCRLHKVALLRTAGVVFSDKMW